MKKIFLTFFTVLFLISCKDSNDIQIRGTYKGAANQTLQLELLNISEVQFIDSVKVNKNGRFSFDFQLSNPELVMLKNSEGKFISMLTLPGDKIDLTIPEDNFSTGYEIEGSEESSKIKALVLHMNESKRKLDSINRELEKFEDIEDPEAGILMSAYEDIYIKQKRHNIKFIIENLHSPSSVYALYQRITPEIYLLGEIKDLQYFKIASDTLSTIYPSSTLIRSLKNDVEKRLANYNSMLLLNQYSKNNKIESGLINLEIENPSGKTISLKSLKGKVVLLQFWASWNEESVKANIKLKKIYDQYHRRGFEIYAVGLENKKESWEKAIHFDEFNWINVSELSYPNSYAASTYNIKSLPANYLIDKEGNIVAKNISGAALATWLDNLLQQ